MSAAQAGRGRWRLLLSPPASGVENMAIDEALLHRARRTGESVLRIYEWIRPTLSLGRNQTARGRYDLAAAARAGIDIVRRPTGGRAVLHHREVTYSVTAPAGAVVSLRESYGRINRLLCDGLRRLGVDAEIGAGVGRAPHPGDAPCFETPTAGELVFADRKLAGSAQWREDDAFLQHGSILIEDDQGLISQLLLRPAAPLPPPATLRAALGHTPSARDVADALFAAVIALEDPGAEPFESDEIHETLLPPLRARYLDEGWTWRR